MEIEKLEPWQLEILNDYLDNEATKLKRLVRKLLIPIGGVAQKDEDDFVSKSSYVLWRVLYKYDKTTNIPFENYLSSCLKRRFITWGIRDTNRLKNKNMFKRRDMDGNIVINERGNPVYETIYDLSLDAPISEGDTHLSEIIEDKTRHEDEISKNVEDYLELLTDTQKKIADLLMNGYSHSEIREHLNMSEEKYNRLMADMRSFEKRLVIKCDDSKIKEDITLNENNPQTLEKSKPDRLSISSIIKKINNQTIRFNHPLQRPSDQWTSSMKGNLISDILQGNPIPPLVFAEEVINGLAIIWDLDGKQRATNCYSFVSDGFKIAKNIRRWNITYQSIIKDASGKQIPDGKGFPQSERKEFDIRGKKFSALPEELQDKILDYNFEITQYINCSKEDIAYHIARYNEGKPMSASHKGIIRLGEEFASAVKSISAMPFFKEKGGYKVSEGNNGTIDRVVVESIMASNFLSDWRKDVNEMCEFMKENATSETFDNFEDMVERISKVDNEGVLTMFDSKDSFIYFGLYARFVDTGLEDEKFVEFMAELSRSLHNKSVNGTTYDDLCFDKDSGKSRATKDKYIVEPKMELLEILMRDYLKLTPEKPGSDDVNILDFIRENVGEINEQNIEQRDLVLYEEDFDTYSLYVDNTSKLMDKKNRPSFLALIAYGYKEDITLDEWFIDYFRQNNTYLIDQKDNYIKMRKDLENYIHKDENEVSM